MASASSQSTVDIDGAPMAATATTRSQPALSASELRAAMQHELRQNGVLKDLKTQLRGSVLTELLKKQKAAALSPAHRRPRHGTEVGAETDMSLEDFEATRLREGGRSRRGDNAPSSAAVQRSSLTGWASRVSDALVENHLRRTRRAMSLSIFSTEAEVAPFSAVGAPSEEEQYLKRLLQCGGSEHDDERDAVESPLGGGRGGESVKSLLQQLVEARLMESDASRGAAAHKHSCSTQTDDTTQTDATNPLTSMECRLAAVDAKYALTFSQLRQNGAEQSSTFFARSEVERRMQQYRQDIREQLTSEFQAKYRAFEQGQLQEAKATYEARYQNLVQIKTEEWREAERSLVVKVEQERQRLALAREDVDRQKLALERRQREAAELLHDHEVAHQDLEAQLRDMREKCRLLQLQSSKWEELCGSRLAELEAARSRDVRRQEDARRMQAEFAAELRLKEEDVARLRFRVRTLVNQQSSDARTRAEEPTVTKGSTAHGEEDDGALGPSSSATNRMNDDLYHVLVRTEELQRNALRQQQLNWEQAWEARDAQPHSQTAKPATTRDEAAVTRAPHNVIARTSIPSSPVSAVVATPITATAVAAGSHTSASPPSVSPIAAAVTQLSSRSGSGESHAQPPVGAREGSRPGAPAQQPATAASPASSSSPQSPSTARVGSDSRSHSDRSRLRSSRSISTENEAADAAAPSSLHVASSTPAPLSAKTKGSDDSRRPDVSHASSSPSSASSPGSASPTRSPDKEAPTSAPSSASASVHAETKDDDDEDIKALIEAEEDARDAVEDEEDSARGGIQWSESSQREVLRAQEAERARDGARGETRALGFIDQVEQQRAQEELQRENIIYRDDEDDDDSILFGGKSDGTDESF